jgi:hypothetical protein
MGIVPAVGPGKRCTYLLQMGGRGSSSPMAHGLREGGGAGLPSPAGPTLSPGLAGQLGLGGARASMGQLASWGLGRAQPQGGAMPCLAWAGRCPAGPAPWARTANRARMVRAPLHPTVKGFGVEGGSLATHYRGRTVSCGGAPVSLPFQKITPPTLMFNSPKTFLLFLIPHESFLECKELTL